MLGSASRTNRMLKARLRTDAERRFKTIPMMDRMKPKPTSGGMSTITSTYGETYEEVARCKHIIKGQVAHKSGRCDDNAQ